MDKNMKEAELLQVIFESSIEGILVTDDKSFIIKANLPAEKMFGYNSGELLNQKMEILFPKKMGDGPEQNHINYLGKPEKQPIGKGRNLFGKKKDGTEFPFEIRLRSTSIANKDVNIVFINDITELEKARQDLIPHALRQNDILRALPGLMFVLNRQGVYLECYAPDPSMLVSPMEELIGKSMYDVLPIALCHKLLNAIDRSAKTGKTQVLEYELTVQGVPGHCEARIVANENGNFLIIVRDRAAAKNAENIIRENEQRLNNYTTELEKEVHERTEELTLTIQKLVETNSKLADQVEKTLLTKVKSDENHALFLAIARHLPKGIIVVIDSDYKIVFSDGEDLGKLGFKSSSLIGVPVNDIDGFNFKSKKRIKKDIEKTLSGKHVSFETEFRDEFYSVNSMPLYNKNNEVERAMFVYQNISKQKSIEQNILNALTKEKELNELKSRFISIASHEFRTPLSTILSSANLISRQNEPGKEGKREKNVLRIKSNVKDLVSILDDFLSLEKMKEGKVTIQPSVFDIIELSKTLIQEVEINKKDGQHIRLVTQGSFIEACLDEKLLRHIILNLLSNAVKYTSENKEIIVDISHKNNRISLLVSDQGVGIPKEEIDYLFTRFFRAKNVAHIQGTGLGLHITKKYIELMEGAIAVESTLNRGASFLVTLPMKLEDNEKDISY